MKKFNRSKKYTEEEMAKMFMEVFGYPYEDPNEEDNTIHTEYELDALRESQKPSQLSINFQESKSYEKDPFEQYLDSLKAPNCVRIDVNFDDEYEKAKNKMAESKKHYVCSSTRWGLVYRGLKLEGNVRLPFESRSVSELAKLYPQYWHEVV